MGIRASILAMARILPIHQVLRLEALSRPLLPLPPRSMVRSLPTCSRRYKHGNSDNVKIYCDNINRTINKCRNSLSSTSSGILLRPLWAVGL